VETPDEKPPILDYRPANADRHRNTAVRVVAGMGFAVFGGGALFFSCFAAKPIPPSEPAIIVAAAGSAFFLLVAMGVIGKNRKQDEG
jgi:hypothetical protein